jgi:hypothetical protein
VDCAYDELHAGNVEYLVLFELVGYKTLSVPAVTQRRPLRPA